MMRLFIALAAWCALGASGTFLFFTHQQIADRQARHRTFETRLDEISASLVDARAAQYAYVAEGQNVSVWAPRAAAHLDAAARPIDSVRHTAAAADARKALTDASSLLSEVAMLDRRAKDYLANGERLMASDVVFSAAADTIEAAGQLIRQAQSAEERQLAADEASFRQNQMMVGGSAIAFIALAVALLAFTRPRADAQGEASLPSNEAKERTERPKNKDLSVLEALRNLENSEEYAKVIKPPRVIYPPKHPAPTAEHPTSVVSEHSTAPVPEYLQHPQHLEDQHLERPKDREDLKDRQSAALLSELATLCASFDAVETEESLQEMLARAAALAEAPRLAVWLEDSATGAFQPVTAHGYSPQALARMPAVTRTADNAVALAGQTKSLQVVPSPAPGARGALVAPLVSAGAAYGVVTVELPDGRESSPTTQAIVTLLATQLAHVFAPAPVLAEPDRHAQTA